MTWVLLDLSFLCYRAMHSVGNLEHEDLPTGVLFGFFHQLRTICEDPRINSNKVAAFCDSRHSLRQQEFPAYKEKRRDRSKEELIRMGIVHDQRRLLEREILPSIGVAVYKQRGLESDDLLAQAAIQLETPLLRRRNGVIVTADGDLYQCITDCVHWFDPQRGIYHTPESFEKEKGIAAHQWGTVKTLAGCKTDSVPGIGRVGEITAIKMLKAGKPVISSKLQRMILKRNQKLVLLPRKETKDIELRAPEWKPDAFFRIAKRYGFSSFLRNKDEWLSFFRGPYQPRMRGEQRKT